MYCYFKIQGNRSRRRKMKKNCSSIELFRAAASKVRIAMMTVNLLRADGT